MKAATIFFGLIACVALLAVPNLAAAQDEAPYECDDRFGQCGTPEQSGGGGCGCGCGCSILVNNTDLGDTYQYADDYDDDGVEDPYDNCMFARNLDQADSDGDSVGDSCDNCPSTVNLEQVDLDGDMIGDLCDNDRDGDEVDNALDNCPQHANPEVANPDGGMWQPDTDGDGQGDVCDEDDDEDGYPDLEDSCPLIANPDQSTLPSGTCYSDADDDDIPDAEDNCPFIFNPDLLDLDGDNQGDECDADQDGDGFINTADNCPAVVNLDQLDSDRDGMGDTCDSRFCFVVYNDVDNCLDPEGTFQVYTPNLVARTGDDVRLRLFANRENAALRYSWRIVEAPAGSGSVIEHPYGAVRLSTPYEYHYVQDHVPAFTPDRPGTYQIHVEVTQVWEDSVSRSSGVVAEWTAVIAVDGAAIGGSCSAAPGSPMGGTAALIGLVGLIGFTIMRRRRG